MSNMTRPGAVRVPAWSGGLPVVPPKIRASRFFQRPLPERPDLIAHWKVSLIGVFACWESSGRESHAHHEAREARDKPQGDSGREQASGACIPCGHIVLAVRPRGDLG